IVIPPAIFFYYSTLFDSRFKTLQQNLFYAFQVGFPTLLSIFIKYVTFISYFIKVGEAYGK
ncbi:hypothetical protein SJ574_14095, partial [Enterococcus faecium]